MLTAHPVTTFLFLLRAALVLVLIRTGNTRVCLGEMRRTQTILYGLLDAILTTAPPARVRVKRGEFLSMVSPTHAFTSPRDLLFALFKRAESGRVRVGRPRNS